MIATVHLKQSFKGLRLKLLLLCVVMFVFQGVFALLSTSVTINSKLLRDLDQMPEVAGKMMGEGFVEAIIKYGILAVGYIHPFILVISSIFIFIAISQVMMSEITSGTIGFTLSKPVSRVRITINLWVVVYSGIALLALSCFAASALGIILFHSEKLSVGPFASIAWNLFLLMIFVTGYVVILAVLSDSGKKLYTYGGITLIFFYLLTFAAPLWKPLEYIAPISPFNYFKPMPLLMGQRITTSTAFWIIVVSMLMFAVAAVLFKRRDIASG